MVALSEQVISGSHDGTISVTASGGARPFQYSKDCGSNWQNDSLFTDLAPGPYNVQVKDAGGCVTSCTPVTITAGAGIQIDEILGLTNCAIQIVATGGTEPYEYSIDGGLNFDSIYNYSSSDGLVNTTYSVYVKDVNGCRDSIISVIVSGCGVSKPCEIYEAFTPNDDGKNDVWNLHCQIDYPDMLVRIFNTWGNTVFESARGYPEPWDGTAKNGNELPAGTYFYVIDWGDGGDPTSGTVNIIK